MSFTTAGKICLRLFTAALAFISPPFKQSSSVYNDCLSGLDIATLPLSSRVIFLTPHAYRIAVSLDHFIFKILTN